MEGTAFKKCLQQIEKIETDTARSSAHPAFQPLFEQIKDVFSPFKENHPHNFLDAARLHLQHGRDQQAITLLQEGLLTALIHHTGLDYSDRAIRITTARLIQEKTREKNEKLNEKWSQTESEKETIAAIQISPLFKSIIETNLYDNLTQLRNDINHGGYNDSSASASKIINNTERYYNEAAQLYNTYVGSSSIE